MPNEVQTPTTVRRTLVAALCVALLTVSAGCGGVLGGEGTPTRDVYGVDPTPTRTASPTETPVSRDPLASAAFREAVANHTATLRSVGNFTIRRTRQGGRVIDGREPPDLTRVTKVDLAADAYASGGVTGNGPFEVEIYQSGSKWYRRSGDGFRNYTGRTDADGYTPERYALEWMRTPPNRSVTFPFERNGTATFEGEEMRRFSADDPGYFRGRYSDLRNVTSFEATALVDDRGILRTFTYTIRGRTSADATYVESETWTVTAPGTTSVPPLESIRAEVVPDGASAAFREAVADHTATLRSVGNFTVREVRVNGPTDPNTARREVEVLAALDFVADRYLVRRRQDGGEGRFSAVTYQNATGVYARGPTTDGFENATGPTVSTARRTGIELVAAVPDEAVGFSFERNGTATFEGEEMRRFTADHSGDFRGRYADLRTVTGFRATALVDDRGIVRRYTYGIRGRTDGGDPYAETVTVEVREVGTTTVAPPAELANATTTDP